VEDEDEDEVEDEDEDEDEDEVGAEKSETGRLTPPNVTATVPVTTCTARVHDKAGGIEPTGGGDIYSVCLAANLQIVFNGHPPHKGLRV
tara:strand:+ start:1880 stop:2146 length:267 start_codon:yes stop_codon:yes gene_type:complete